MNMYTVPLSSDLNMKYLTNHEFQEVGEGLYIQIYGFFSSWPQNNVLCIWERSLIKGQSEHVYCSLSFSLNMKCLINHRFQEVGIVPQ